MNRDTEVYADPVELPDGVFHGGQTAYGPRYRCRCRYCVKWRRLYDSVVRYRQQAAQRERKTAATAYLEARGIFVYAGPFKNRSLPLAQLIARHLGDNLDDWRES